MITKKCFKCNTNKTINDFYKHNGMSDGYLGKCKECAKKDVKNRYYSDEGRKKVTEYEAKRFKNPDRKRKLLQYQRNRRINNVIKRDCMCKWSYALSRNKIIKKPCIICGNKIVEGHHRDYTKPLEVIWLCRKHHLEEHYKLRRCFYENKNEKSISIYYSR